MGQWVMCRWVEWVIFQMGHMGHGSVYVGPLRVSVNLLSLASSCLLKAVHIAATVQFSRGDVNGSLVYHDDETKL